MKESGNTLPVLASMHEVDLLGFQGGTWVDGETIGRKLEYEHPEDSIRRLYNRHKDAFLEGETCRISLIRQSTQKDETCRVNLTRQVKGKIIEQRREVRIFSVPRGVMRICMISRAKKPLEAQDAILDTFDRYRFGMLLLNNQAQACVPSEWYCRELKKVLGGHTARRIIHAMSKGAYEAREYVLPLAEIARIDNPTEHAAMVRKWAQEHGKSIQTAYRRLSQVRSVIGERLSTKKGKPRRTRSDRGNTKYPEERQQALAYVREHPKARGRTIKQALGLQVSDSRINAWIREHRIMEAA